MKMKKIKPLLGLALAATMVINVAACSPGTSGSKANAKFDEFTMDLFREEVTCDTITLNYTLAHPENYGITEYDITYGSTDLSELGDDSDVTEALKEFKKFPYSSLSDDQKLTYDLWVDYLQTELEYSDLYLYDKSLSPTIGFNCQLPVVLAEYSFRSQKDVYDYINLLNQTDAYFEYILEIEKLKSEKGLFMTDDIADLVIEQCETFIDNPEDNYLIEVFNDKIADMDFSDAEKKDLKKQNKDAVLNHVIKAYSLLADGLKELKGTGQYEGGLCNYPDGARYYEYLCKSGTGSKRSVKDMEKLVDKYMSKYFRSMGKLLNSNPEVVELAENYSFNMTDPYEILTDLQKRIEAEFPKLPDVNYTIKYVHKSMEEHMSPAFYMTPAIDDYKENRIYINNGSPNPEIYTTLAHEGFPGHLYQIVYTNSKNPAPVRALLNFSGYTEGWATYVEMMSFKMGALENEALGELLSANQLITLGVYAKCDIGINVHGWTLQDTKDYVSSYFGSLDDDVYTQIYNAMVSEPANYLKYVIGCLEFMELRDKAENTLNDKFNPVAFHDFIMTIGPAPFDILEKRMDDWMKTQ